MQKIITLKVLPSEANNPSVLSGIMPTACAVTPTSISGFNILKKSIDARSRQVWINLTVQVFIDEPLIPLAPVVPLFKDVASEKNKIIIIGAGPAGLFAALRLIEYGIKPIVLERGKDVRSRRRDLAAMNKTGAVNPESNYCFGEGGAGTYSDGKLYTRSTKRGDVQRILNTFVYFGADPKIRFEAHPHIGTNKLPQIITAITAKIKACGGEVLFEKKVTDFLIKDNVIQSAKTSDGQTHHAAAFILATGHSARDIYTLLYHKKILVESKPFALGVRVEHPQNLIDTIQYHNALKDENLPPASYSLVEQIEGKGVFSFCMCPGGIIAPAATNANEIVVNGWSPSKRNNPYANSGIVTSVEDKHYGPFLSQGALAGMYFQQDVEHKAFLAGGGLLVAPAQRMVDFTNDKISSTLPGCSYIPGIHACSLKEILPGFIHTSLQKAFKSFGTKLKGYFTNEAVVVAPESRTSSPVRIPRNSHSCRHPQIINLYPCGEGAGYAGGIVSAAMDGEKISNAIAETLGKK